MLAQAFLSHDVLGIAEIERDALVTVLGMLERGEIDGWHFNMNMYLDKTSTCMTVGCICGWAHHVSGREAFPWVSNDRISSINAIIRMPKPLLRLFLITPLDAGFARIEEDYELRKAARAHHGAIALRNFLTIGEAYWQETLAAQA